MSKLMQMIGASTLALTAGCATTANTNTLDLSQRTQTYSLPKGNVDYVDAKFDFFAMQPTGDYDLRTSEIVAKDGKVTEGIIPGRFVLDYAGIPVSDSQIRRVGNRIDLSTDAPRGHLVYLGFNDSGKAYFETDGELEDRFIVTNIERKTMTLGEAAGVTEDRMFARQIFDELRNESEILRVGEKGDEFLQIPAIIGDRATNMYLQLPAQPAQHIIRTPGDEEGTVNIVTRTGVYARPYGIVVGNPGELVKNPMTDEKKVLEGSNL